MTLDLTKYSDKSTLIWAVNNIKLPKNTAWSFEDRQWQIQIMDDTSEQIVCRKPTQIGMSTVFLTKMLHFADTHQCRTVMTLPRQDDVYDMVNSRLYEIINESPYIQNKIAGVDNVRMKKFGKSWLHFMEMSVPPRMMDVDWMLNDEVDLSNMEYLEQAVSRMDASKFGFHHRISTPTIHDYGIDALYKLSDQKEWFVTCGYCSYEQTLTWFSNVAHKDGNTWYKCAKCGNKIHPQDIREGRWIATGNPNAPISGYQITQLMCTYIDPNKLWVQYKTINPKNFHNFRLGLPYAQATGGFNREIIVRNSFLSNHQGEDYPQKNANYVIGCDQGNVLHYVIAEVISNMLRVVKVGTIPFEKGFEELGRLIELYKPKMTVLDGLPNHHSSRSLISNYPNKSVTAYFHQIDTLYKAKLDEQKVTINKTDSYDLVYEKINKSEIQLYRIGDAIPIEVDTMINHLTNMQRDSEESKSKIGGAKIFHVWKNTGPDHYADALLYACIAADMVSGSEESLDIVDLGRYNGLLESGAYLNISNDPNKLYMALTGERHTEDVVEPSLTRLNTNEVKMDDMLAPSNPYAENRAMGRLFGLL